MRKQFLTIVITALLTLNLVLLIGTGNPNQPANETIENTENVNETVARTRAVKIPKTLELAGETVPLHDHSIRERLDRELLINTYWHSSTIFIMKQSSRYFPVIEPILQEEGVPNDFKYLAVAESGLQNVISPSKAVGVWQFMSATGQEYGMEVSSEIDERYHLEKATRAACAYLKKAKAKFGTWTKAAAAYNMGMDGLRRHIEHQGEDSYYDLFMNRETSRYIFRILAFKEIFENPQDYGFAIEDEDLYAPRKFVEVPVSGPVTDWAKFAKEQQVNYKILKEYNPWIRKKSLKNTYKKTYNVRIPA
jgi:hypothetical protein